MKRKIVALCVVVAMLAVAVVSSTMAYFTDVDQAVNVMTMGNVKIKMHESRRIDATKVPTIDNLENFNENDVDIHPAVYTSITWQDNAAKENEKVFSDDMNNVYDKFIYVENVGKSAAYFRTFLLFEDTDNGDGTGVADLLHLNITNDDYFKPVLDNNGEILHLNVDGAYYEAYVYTYPEPLEAGEFSEFSLKQFFFDKATTNEDVAACGEKYTIIAFTQAIQAAGFTPDAVTYAADDTQYATRALNEGFGEPTGVSEDGKTLNIAVWSDGAVAEDNKSRVDTWDGTADTSWYNDTDTEFIIVTAEALAGFAKLVDEGNTFEGKTVKLGGNIDLYNEDANGEAVCFEPIGSYRFEKSFMGTFDGQNNTISNMSQNTWALDNGYHYNDCGLGLFGAIEGGTVKNLIIDGADISGESAICGSIAAFADDATFENITVKNANVADYQYYAGGIVGWASGETEFIGCNIDASTNVAAQWGDFDNSIGGVIGGAGGSAKILIKDTTVACRIDAYNDVTSAGRWYAYRRAGMLIGNPGKTVDVNGTTVAAAPQLTCENVTVIYGDWANYTYCEFNDGVEINGKWCDPNPYPYVRVQAGVSNSAYSNPRYGHPNDKNGAVENDNHVHNDGEDHQILCVFDQLYGGGQGVYGCATHEGVTVVYNNK